MLSEPHHRVAVVGTGFGGLGIAHQLRRAGVDDVVLLERADGVGGVWRDNTYPGAACDVQSHLYSFSFAKKPDWTREFSPQPEILGYLQACAREFGLLDRIRFGTEVTGMDWEDGAQRWRVETTAGPLTADVVVLAAGVLSDPAIPELPGIERFEGPQFHSATWRHDVDLTGKAVAVVGTGASAIQFVPAIQPQVAALTLFQRTPPWVMPRHDGPIAARKVERLRRHPRLRTLERLKIAIERELFIVGFRNPGVMRLPERVARKHLAEQVSDPVKRAKLTPSFRIGCKRILLSNDYLRALDQPNADVVTSGIAEVRARSIVDRDGIEHDADVIVHGTGFRIHDLPWARWVRGRDGRTLAEAWQGSMKAYRGTTVAGFPNLALIHGPNIGTGHTSVIEMYEGQFRYIVAAVRHMDTHGIGALEPTAEAQRRDVEEVDAMTEGTVWTAGGCSSWYLDETGRNSALWPGSTVGFRLRTRRFVAADHRLVPASRKAVAA